MQGFLPVQVNWFKRMLLINPVCSYRWMRPSSEAAESGQHSQAEMAGSKSIQPSRGRSRQPCHCTRDADSGPPSTRKLFCVTWGRLLNVLPISLPKKRRKKNKKKIIASNSLRCLRINIQSMMRGQDTAAMGTALKLPLPPCGLGSNDVYCLAGQLLAIHFFSDNESIRCVTRTITAKLVMWFLMKFKHLLCFAKKIKGEKNHIQTFHP